MRSLLITIALFLIVGGSAVTLPGQSLPPAETLRLNVDFARFRGGDDSTVTVEVYYSFPQRGLTYKPDSAGYAAALDLTLLISRKDSLLYGDRWLVPHVVHDTASLRTPLNLVGMYTLSLGKGEYVLKVIGRDRNDRSRADSVLQPFAARVFTADKVMLSDIELAASVTQGASKGPFYKNTLEVVPNVGGVFGEHQKCFYYAEAYNLLLGDDRSEYAVRATVYDAVGKQIISRERPKKRLVEASVLVDNLTVDNMRTGTYTLVVALLDSAKKTLGSSGRKFFVYNPSLGIDSTLLSSARGLPMNVYVAMDEAELDHEFRWLRYEAQETEKDQYEQLKGVDAKRKFLSDFWRRRELGRREEYLNRVQHANASFSMLGREGYRTDRGRVFITYGPPDDFDRHPNDSDSRPYEIWSYNNIQGGVMFVFVMRNAGGDYELVHSTHRNELHDENWQRFAQSR
jgi:GWxTD domain-containing protein